MYDIIAIVLEITTVSIITNSIYVNKIHSSNYAIIFLFSIFYGVINQKMTINTMGHYAILCFLTLVLHRKERKQIAIFAALIAYAVLIYLQVICLRWFSTGWVETHYELAGLVLNVLVFSIVLVLRYLLQWRKVDVMYEHLKKWQIFLASGIALGIILFCIIYKPILEEQYYIDSYTWLCLVGGVFTAMLMIERQSATLKNKQMIQDLQRRIDTEYGYRHDYEKQLRVMSGEGNPFAEEILHENEQQLCYDRLPECLQKIIGSYANEYIENGIVLKFDVPEPISDWKISFKDSISIFGNLIENAIEAVQEIRDGDRWIEIVVKREYEGNLHIETRNPYVEKAGEDLDILKKGISSKSKERGYGLYIVEQKLEKYRGEIRVYKKDSVFEVIIDVSNE